MPLYLSNSAVSFPCGYKKSPVHKMSHNTRFSQQCLFCKPVQSRLSHVLYVQLIEHPAFYILYLVLQPLVIKRGIIDIAPSLKRNDIILIFLIILYIFIILIILIMLAICWRFVGDLLAICWLSVGDLSAICRRLFSASYSVSP